MTTIDTMTHPAFSAPPEGQVPSAWQLSALLQPGLIRAGTRWLSTAPRLWVEWASQITRDALERSLERTISIESLSDEEHVVQQELAARGLTAREAAFAIAIAHRAFGNGWVVLDLTAARVVVDSLEADFASLRGAETLSDTELGLLEYATLACIDHALRAIAPRGEAFAITDFPDPAKFRETLDADQGYRVTLRLRIAGRQGFLRVYLPGFPSEPPEALPDRNASAAASGAVELRLALPGIKLSRDELKSLRAGDVLLPGISDLTSLAGCTLASSSGWVVSMATVTRDSAMSVAVRCGAVKLGVRDVGDKDRVVLTPLMGRVSCAVEELKRLAPGGSIELQKDASAAVELYDGLDCLARGEMVRMDGEIAIRLLECRRPMA